MRALRSDGADETGRRSGLSGQARRGAPAGRRPACSAGPFRSKTPVAGAHGKRHGSTEAAAELASGKTMKPVRSERASEDERRLGRRSRDRAIAAAFLRRRQPAEPRSEAVGRHADRAVAHVHLGPRCTRFRRAPQWPQMTSQHSRTNGRCVFCDVNPVTKALQCACQVVDLGSLSPRTRRRF